MRLSHFVQGCAALALSAIAAPALANDQPAPSEPPLYQPGVAPAGPDSRPEWRENTPQGARYAMDSRARDEWLGECRQRIARRDNGVGGALIGGVVGGIAGNRIAGRGNRTAGTIAGAAVGAVAGAAIDRAEDNGRVRDECESYLDSYYDYYAYASRHPGYGFGYQPAYGYAAGCCQAAPVAIAPRREPECTETVEYVYEDVPARPKVRRIPTKRVKIVPDKRIKTQ